MKASESHPHLKSLIADFKAFRSQSRPHTRIPEHLRRAALDAIASGLKPSLVARNLKVSPSQLIRWQQRDFCQTIPKDAPRILDVIPSIPVQSDLATVNLVSDAELAARFEIELAGCTSHARRPFALYENYDPDACAHMLHLFRGLYI
ncbi:MAG: hypothetical protein H7249_07060 [Chitinophagaceae bacterium]|nr:hypothetical protein [Oligoflexus sp.]